MASLIKTTTFSLLSPFGLNAKGELVEVKSLEEGFKLLLHVKLKDGREGLLLCAHYCKWPQELLTQADFLEGCYTPEEFKGDSRLLLGYHPGSVTSYKEVQPGVIEISTILVPDLSGTTRSFQRLVPESELPSCKDFRRFRKIAKRLFWEAIEHELPEDAAFSALEQRWEEWQHGTDTRLHLSPFLFSYMLTALHLEDFLVPNGRLSVDLEEYTECCEVSGNTVRVIYDNPRLGFHTPVPFEPVLEIEDGVTKVVENRMDYGFAKAINIFTGPSEVKPIQLEKGMAEVMYKGFKESLPYKKLDGALIVENNHLEYGWWKAQNI